MSLYAPFHFVPLIKHSGDPNYIIVIATVDSRFSGQFHYKESVLLFPKLPYTQMTCFDFCLENTINVIYSRETIG